MKTDTGPAIVQQHSIPESILSLSTMRPDYVDLFTARTRDAAGRPPEKWARAGIEDAAGLAGQFIWRVLCGLRLAPRHSPDHVAGWTIADRGERWVRLEAASWFLTAHIVFWIEEEQVSVATFIRYDRPVAAFIWGALSIGHRQAVPGLLRQAVSTHDTDGS
jgi:hypothetical protein